jgi:hypothetical protein
MYVYMFHIYFMELKTLQNSNYKHNMKVFMMDHKNIWYFFMHVIDILAILTVLAAISQKYKHRQQNHQYKFCSEFNCKQISCVYFSSILNG